MWRWLKTARPSKKSYKATASYRCKVTDTSRYIVPTVDATHKALCTSDIYQTNTKHNYIVINQPSPQTSRQSLNIKIQKFWWLIKVLPVHGVQKDHKFRPPVWQQVVLYQIPMMIVKIKHIIVSTKTKREICTPWSSWSASSNTDSILTVMQLTTCASFTSRITM
jgi:hypothetical protein